MLVIRDLQDQVQENLKAADLKEQSLRETDLTETDRKDRIEQDPKDKALKTGIQKTEKLHREPRRNLKRATPEAKILKRE